MKKTAVMETSEMSFESALKRMEEIVAKMESGNLSLQDTIAYFEEGMTLSKRCDTALNEAEGKIEKLLKSAEKEA